MSGSKIVLILLLTSVIGLKAHTSKECHCPDFSKICDFENSCEVKKLQENVFDELWNFDETLVSDLGDDLVDVLEDMLYEKIPFWRRYSLAVTEYSCAYLPCITWKTNLCPYAMMINATLSYKDENDCPKMMKAVNATCKAFTEAGKILTAASIKNSGCSCKDLKPVVPTSDPCYKNGFAYDIDEIWSTLGWRFPCKLHQIVKKLYKSCDLKDKLMALMATAVLTEQCALLEREYDPEPLYKLFVMLTPGEIPKRCCKKFIEDALELSDSIQVRNEVMFKKARESTGCLSKSCS